MIQTDPGGAAPATLDIVGRLLAPEDRGVCRVTVRNGRIVDISEVRGTRANDEAWITPGLVDIQLNGAFGVDFSDPDADLARASAMLPRTGVTAFLPTLVSGPPERYAACIGNLDGPQAVGAARTLGVHLEGPFLAPARRGAHDPGVLREPNLVEALAWLETGPVAMVTLAPELSGSVELVRSLSARGVIVAIGHSDATWDEADAAIRAGARLGTHLFNAMRPFHHREPGIAGRLLASGVAASVIIDGVHLAPETVQLVASAKAAGEVVFVTDGLAALGQPPGSYRLGDREVVSDGTVARLQDGTLSGSVLPMAGALGRLVARGMDPATVVRAASSTPASLLGRGGELGRVEVGRPADLVLLDGGWNPVLTLVQGRIGHESPAFGA